MKLPTILTALLVFSFSHSQTAEEYINRGLVKAESGDFIGAIADYSMVIEIS